MQIDERLNCLLPQYRRLRRLPSRKKRSLRAHAAYRCTERKQVWTGALIRNKNRFIGFSSVAYAIQRMSRVVGCTIFLLPHAPGASRETDVGRKSVYSQSIAPLSALSLFYELPSEHRILHSREVKTHLEVECAASRCTYIYIIYLRSILRQQS